MLPAVKVENLWKEYVVGQAVDRHATFYDTLSNALKAPFKKRDESAVDPTKFWALNDVGFEVQPGEVVGIIGRNGAGKSTLLKILSRITAPTKGRVEVRGRLASLLEVGTGFHGELSGRENIFLNGAILGMSRKDIAKKFDEIVAFAEVEKFIDTPVKRYSSGMYVRLAFAVAAHLETDVLIIDEVLAVGDSRFQRRCLDRIAQLRDWGRAILLVSHNAFTVRELCTRGIVLSRGCVVADTTAYDAVDHYAHGDFAERFVSVLFRRSENRGDGSLTINDLQLCDVHQCAESVLVEGGAVSFIFSFSAVKELHDVFVAFDLRDADGNVLVNFNNRDYGRLFPSLAVGDGKFICKLPAFPLREGMYYGNVFVESNEGIHEWQERPIQLRVSADEQRRHPRTAREAKVLAESHWEYVGWSSGVRHA